MRNLMMGCLACAYGVVCLPRAQAQAWPEDEAWHVLFCGEVPSFDPHADESGARNERDIVGDSAHPALYDYADDDHFYMRMPVDATHSTRAGGFVPSDGHFNSLSMATRRPMS
jgi:hypothetical protein